MRPRTFSILTVLVLAACGGATHPLSDCRPANAIVPATVGSGSDALTLHVEIADDAGERATGLMGRSSLPVDRGMAFLYEDPVLNGFWMKGTSIPLSIAFWGRDGRISDILDMEPCAEDPCTVYEPAHPYVGAIEVAQGVWDRAGIRIGDRVRVTGIGCA